MANIEKEMENIKRRLAKAMATREGPPDIFWARMFVRSWAIASGKDVPPADEYGLPWCVSVDEKEV